MARILVVDDEPWICRALIRSLKAHHDVMAVACVRDALLRIMEGRFDLILCDVGLGNHSGTLLRDQLQHDDPAQALRIVFMSGDAADLCAVGGPTLTKPFDSAALTLLVDDCLADWGDPPMAARTALAGR